MYWFPSPTGVNYYECQKKNVYIEYNTIYFRPQQGLTIMNQPFTYHEEFEEPDKDFRPQQGLTIMNHNINKQ